ncbi:transposase [Kibdelosporangium philippinense]|uniref:Transposase n=1 Tax=Kibdelosporangium philippinense TaxID=211113 RepID=A0ABS8ZKE6_9PSEU|nr:transposase [Kibdelosporangium philippinense]MCE7007106.1 transposase [Kibdelosporangium philippinense]
MTGRLRAAAGRAVADEGRTGAQAAREWGLSWPVVHAAFLDHAVAVLPEEPEPVRVLGIDEVRRGKPRFAVNAESGVLKRRVRKDDPEYGLRWRLLRNREDLTTEKFTDMWNRLTDLGQAGDEILSAWIAKEELRTLLALARIGASRHQISHHLWTFYRWCADTDIAELHPLARTIQDWWPQIEAFILTGITNAASEGING